LDSGADAERLKPSPSHSASISGMSEEQNVNPSHQSWLNVWVEKGLRYRDDLGIIARLAAIPAGLVLLLIPGALETALGHPFDAEEIMRSAVLHTLPLTLAVAMLFVSAIYASKAETLWPFLISIPIIIFISGALADHFGCLGCNGEITAQNAKDLAYDWTPSWIRSNAGPLNAIPLLLAFIAEYVRRYDPGTFLASLVCGAFLGLSVLWLLRPRAREAETKATE
jgi:hypothetical protein